MEVLHNDLRKLNDRQIGLEVQYLNKYIRQLIDSLTTGVASVVNRQNPDKPLWMTNSDLANACDRLQACMDELDHRKI